MNRNMMFAAAAVLAMGGAMSPAGFGFPDDSLPLRQHHRKAEPEMAGRSKKKFKGSKAAKRAARRHK